MELAEPQSWRWIQAPVRGIREALEILIIKSLGIFTFVSEKLENSRSGHVEQAAVMLWALMSELF